ncbi:AN1-type zinc finger protein 4-like [Euwallacea fornicatus]|uniref:AN1-type zinc finger protein 4-like n=1 Tax=Euwallacea fornicatus TaxID=995702 RepID=UPI00338E6CFE
MSEDGFSDNFDEPNIEIQIKTLLGTTFDIKVSSNDTVSAIKKKIFRVEGIPVFQQNLIFQSEELKDTSRLLDAGIRNGSTLILVSAMRGGPISTRRLSVSCEHYILKELKDLLETSKDEMTPGSKVSVLVFKEGDIINLLRVIENEDGSYSPYNEGPISPPSKPSRRDTLEAFERLVEDTEMCTKITTLRKKMDELNIKKQSKIKSAEDVECSIRQSCYQSEPPEGRGNISYRFLEECSGELLDNVDLTVFEKHIDEGNQSESEEIALKDKHRTKPKVLQNICVPKPKLKSLYSERRGSYSQTREAFARIAKRLPSRSIDQSETNIDSYTITFSRERQPNSFSASQMDNSPYPNALPSLNSLENDRLNSPDILANIDGLDDCDEERIPMANNCSENPYLLQGLNSNKLPDLRIFDTDDFLPGELDESERILASALRRGTAAIANDNSNFLNLPSPTYLANNTAPTGSATFRTLPDLTSNRLTRSNFGSTSDAKIIDRNCNNSTPALSTVSRAGGSQLTGLNKLPQVHSLDSRCFCHTESSSCSNKLPQASYSLSAAKLSPPSSSSSLDAPLPNLTRLESLGNLSSSRGESPILGAAGGSSVEEMGAKLAEQLQLLDEEANKDLYGESYSMSARNRVRLTRLVLATEVAERPKSSPDSIELEERTQDLWEIHEPASERLKRSATCQVGLLKRRQGIEYNYDGLENPQSKLKPELSNLGNYSQSSTEFGVCSGANFFVPQYLSAPSAIPPQYAPKHHPKYCDLFFSHEPRSPLYNRRNRRENLEANRNNPRSANLERDCSSIERLKNDENVLESKEQFRNEDLFGYCNLGCAANVLDKVEESKEIIKLPPVIKKKSRCSECNKRLNITNIYNCRCGRIFCSQHRYSEVHRCTYDYKTEGRKILERQNPLVTGQKVQRF